MNPQTCVDTQVEAKRHWGVLQRCPEVEHRKKVQNTMCERQQPTSGIEVWAYVQNVRGEEIDRPKNPRCG